MRETRRAGGIVKSQSRILIIRCACVYVCVRVFMRVSMFPCVCVCVCVCLCVCFQSHCNTLAHTVASGVNIRGAEA
jgi:hypothetical protein